MVDDRLTSDLASLRIDRNEPPPSSKKAVAWVAGLAFLGAAAFGGWRVAAPMVEASLF